jgi:gliding motility-associated-like protein
VNLTASTGTCSKSFLAPDYINVYPIPSAAIETYPPIVSIFEPVIEFSYEATSSVYTQTWILGDGFTSSDPGFEHTFSDTGIFTVYLVLENAQGCIDTMETTVWVRPDYTLYVPNCFTPDLDGINDEFRAYGQGILQFEMNIFNRWGEQLYHSADLNESWDGKVNGNNAPAGTYIWIIHYTDALHKKHMVNGHVIIFY